ncbi:NAD(P)-dependent dehydrogenase (short-subunit alcohol dehydrogenase family) [Hymenobacter luteus]|uniref:NAD(P)-dependent dehydrogenase (Short-subunit alcohol dehydrogenase family) n=2 Tax=Hymenobacter TaxID=89966 RepID=A0A7W9SWZ2_9BACT|nr:MULTISPECIES: SDR family oxidoreductase [Hymenobacter]MBB4600290.1 NAD(P)-dependent dehydrogenase (short-subunit alcohol dehydrogenase family) [Hymenobacter latericoloratus]MBB6057400.1 NAD(P)-dependent dehydrogenase (short-subunit alcohol dehydrogenase family) [Hymenobacter luteus]
MDLQLAKKVALITGSTAGIGLAIARRLAAEGAEVILTGRTEARLQEARTAILQETPAAAIRTVPVDFSKPEQVTYLLLEVPSVDILINNVGIFEPKPFAEIPDQDWLRFFEVNVMSGVRLSRQYFPQMLEKKWGRIVFVSSESGLQIPAEMIHYGTTKAAQLAVARGLAELTKGTEVTVNSVLPGPTASEGVEEFLQKLAGEGKTRQEAEHEFFRDARPSSLLQRFIRPEEVASMVAYLASPLSVATNGASVRVDGGVVRSIG